MIGDFHPTKIGQFRPTLSGDFRPALTKSSLEQIGDFAKQAFLPEETKAEPKDTAQENQVKKKKAACICSNCGAVLPNGAKFCIECGTKIEA